MTTAQIGRIDKEALSKAAGGPQPRFPNILITQARGLSLEALERDGLRVETNFGERLLVSFKRIGQPERAWRGTGWMQVKLWSSFGGVSTLLYEPEAGHRVSGLLRLRGSKLR